tara:strand:+ start:418 stop:1344 length:927 start_codon:yes stop_codon:yes gene_type:complete
MNDNLKKITVGSRGSKLARKQVEIFIKLLKTKKKDILVDKKFIKTTGDKILNKNLYEIGNKSLFTKEIDQAHIKNLIDVSVHSLKDLQYKLIPSLDVACYLPREDFRDGLVSKENVILEELKENAIIGTSSVRREAQLKLIRDDLRFKSIRGNIETRIKKLNEKKYDAIVLAMAGLNRLNLRGNISPLCSKKIVPSVGQGTIAVICKKKDKNLFKVLKSLSDSKTELASQCERIFLSGFQGNCNMPVGALARVEFKKVFFDYFVSNPSNGFFAKGQKIFNISNCLDESHSLGKEMRINYIKNEKNFSN